MLPITDTNCRLSDEQPRCRESDRGLIHEWFEARAASHPDAVALRCEARFLTYGELNRRANRLARRLRELGAEPGVLVGLSAERSVDLVVGIVAILKAGGAYLPIDPSYPSHRQALLVADAGAPILLTQAALRDRLPDHSARIELLDDDAGWPAGDGNLARTAGSSTNW
jgi:non-ribosomal peptide synthetase component F